MERAITATGSAPSDTDTRSTTDATPGGIRMNAHPSVHPMMVSF